LRKKKKKKTTRKGMELHKSESESVGCARSHTYAECHIPSFKVAPSLLIVAQKKHSRKKACEGAVDSNGTDWYAARLNQVAAWPQSSQHSRPPH
jgi:hypothetical protein